MTPEIALLTVAAVGHAYLIVVAVNAWHGTGIDARWMDKAVSAMLAVLGLTTVAGMAWLMSRPWSDWPGAAQAYVVVCSAAAVVVLPLVTIARALRRRPEGVEVSETSPALPDSIDPSELAGRGWEASMLKRSWNQSLRPEAISWRVELPNMPPRFEGLSIAHLTDLHFRRCFDRRYFEALVERSSDWSPDLIVFTGDLIDEAETIDWIVPVLGRANARLGRFAILGNHDRYYGASRVSREIERAGWTLLEGRWTTLDLGGSTLAIGGTSAPWGPWLDPVARPDADFHLLLSHTPDLLGRASNWGIDLMLAGHNHGGQVALPVVGPVLMPSRYSRRFDRGFFRRGPTLMYVGLGIAAKHPLRYGCPPELTRLELRAVPGRPHPLGRHAARPFADLPSGLSE
jgi:predicted MPP superfamily phosphohydrolase